MKEKFLEQRLSLSEDLAFAIQMIDEDCLHYKEKIPLLKEEIDRIDRILELI